MRRRELLTTAGTALTAGIAGCLGGNSGGAAGSDSADPGRRLVTVSGVGKVRGDPDRARLELSLEARGDEPGTVRDDLAARAQAVRAALVDAGVDEGQITTSRFNIDERVDHRRLREADVDPDSPAARDRFRFYQGRHSLEVEVDDTEQVGPVIDAAVDAGVDGVDRVVFTLSEEKRARLRGEAVREAVRNARSEAGAVADEVGADVAEATVVDASRGRIEPVAQSGDAVVEATPAPRAEDSGRPPTGVEPGGVTVTVDVDVRYRME
jgi:Uncharacterized conserved protein